MATSHKKTLPQPEYVTVAKYIRKKHELMLQTDALAKPVQRRTIMRAIERGDIKPYMQGTMLFIDWTAYQNFVFRQYGNMPVKRTA